MSPEQRAQLQRRLAVLAEERAAAPEKLSPVVETRKRKGDRHADPKAHSAKTAARARAKRAATK